MCADGSSCSRLVPAARSFDNSVGHRVVDLQLQHGHHAREREVVPDRHEELHQLAGPEMAPRVGEELVAHVRPGDYRLGESEDGSLGLAETGGGGDAALLDRLDLLGGEVFLSLMQERIEESCRSGSRSASSACAP